MTYKSPTDFSNHIKMSQLKYQPLDTVQFIAIDPARANMYGFMTGGWDGNIR